MNEGTLILNTDGTGLVVETIYQIDTLFSNTKEEEVVIAEPSYELLRQLAVYRPQYMIVFKVA